MGLHSSRNSPVRFTDSWASVHFDLLRGLAAFFVLFEHWRNLFYIDFPQLTVGRRALAALYVLGSAGHQSVIIFFVLSGYFIGGTTFRALERNQWSWSAYLLRRFVRLWTVLVPALLLCLFWDKLGIHLGRAPALYAGHVPNNIVFGVALTPRVFFGNLFFLQTIVTPFFGSDGALWSLANEFWYYLLFPLGLVALWRGQRAVHRLLCAALFLAAAWFIGAAMVRAFPLWLAGVVLFKLPRPSFAPQKGRTLRIVASVIYAPIFFGIGRLAAIQGTMRDYVLTIITTFFLWIMLSATDGYVPEQRPVRASREFARFSYTLYAVHLPFLVFLTAVVVRDSRWYPTPLHLLAGLGILVAALVYSYALAFLTEFRTDGIRSRLEKLFGIISVPPILPSNPLKDVGHPVSELNSSVESSPR